ncbi:GntR family transcriptional regulator [Phytoactinopolyspora endophytica]|uniref:GntR family transcriptional regulator n=1 Tax=Phytoactinopolyspora endophytica TaxID=1642495 RepID=UPI00197C3AC6|nr:GntR family transcriptional regulator [Phytoactinopolyspora endophytica]
MALAGSDMAPARLKRQMLRDDVYKTLLDMLLEERLKPGASLSIDGLARDLGVSPTPVREALVFLEHTGLVARAALKGYKVAPRLSAAQMSDLIDARAVVELAAIRRAAERGQELLPRLREAHEGHLAATNELVRSARAGTVPSGPAIRAYFEADWEFHLVVVDASGNTFLRQMLDGLGAHLHRMMQSAGRGVMDWEVALSEHGRVLSAIEAAEPDRAVEAMRQHLAGVQGRALAEFAPDDERDQMS